MGGEEDGSVFGFLSSEIDQDRSLVSVTIPAGVIRIGEGAFNGCSSLMEVKMEGSVEHIGSRAFSGTPWGRSQSVIP